MQGPGDWTSGQRQQKRSAATGYCRWVQFSISQGGFVGAAAVIVYPAEQVVIGLDHSALEGTGRRGLAAA